MKKPVIIFLAALCLSSAVLAASPRKIEKYFEPKLGREVEVAAGEVLVKYKSKAVPRALGAKLGGNFRLLSTSAPRSVADLIAQYKKDQDVEYVGPNYIVRAFTTTPDDTNYDLQWGLPKIAAGDGWDLQKGSAGVVIAVIDTGMQLAHEDLSAQKWVNSGEIPSNGIDDDGNGYIDDVNGWDFVNADNDPEDDYGHGTHVAGIGAAATNNSQGVAGVSWFSKLMTLKILDASGSGTDSDLILALHYAADNGAKVINLSLGSDAGSVPLQDAVNYAYGKGCVIVAAAGNFGDLSHPTNYIAYPASCDNAFSVAAVDKNDNHSAYSCYNAYVDISAPGGTATGGNNDIYSCVIGNSYNYKAGTSMATPFVAGLAALLFAHHPGWTNDQVTAEIGATAEDLGTAGRDDYFGQGRINVYQALNGATTSSTTTTSTTTVGSPTTSTSLGTSTTVVSTTTTTVVPTSTSYGAGINLISIPYYPPAGEGAAATLQTPSGLQLVRWDPAGTGPVKYETPTALVPGAGYAVKLPAGVSVTVNGTTPPTNADFEIPCHRSWNQIGDPFLSTVVWNEVKVKVAGTILTMSEAVNQGYVKSGPFRYQSGVYQAATTLSPWLGYWVKVSTDLTLVIAHP